jgi:hypothetical protein
MIETLRKYLLLESVILILFLVSSCDLVDKWKSTELIEEALEKGQSQHTNHIKPDTLDFGKLTTFDWDTMYFFGGYINRGSLSKELGYIDWEKGFWASHDVDEQDYRFIFVKGHKATNYVDVSTSLLDRIHYSKYYKDEEGNLNDYFYDSNGNLHAFTLNKWSKADSRFVLVNNALHPVKGCRYSDCPGNSSSKQ